MLIFKSIIKKAVVSSKEYSITSFEDDTKDDDFIIKIECSETFTTEKLVQLHDYYAKRIKDELYKKKFNIIETTTQGDMNDKLVDVERTTTWSMLSDRDLPPVPGFT